MIPLYIKFLAPDEPAKAIELAAWLEDKEKSEQMIIASARIWRQQDEAAAEAWLLQSPLSEEAREKARVPTQ